MEDIARGSDAALVGASMVAGEGLRWDARLRVDKYDDDMTAYAARLGIHGRGPNGAYSPAGRDFEMLGVKPYETLEVPHNLLTTAGLQRLTNLLIGAGGTALTNTTARIGVGNSATAAAVGQTDLQAAAGSANRWFQIMDATYPTAVNGLVTLRATFATGDGNFVWAEVGSDIGTATVTSANTVNATLLNRFVQALGTKASGSWVLTETITIS